MTSLSNDYQRWLYYRFFPRATAWPFHTSYSATYCWKNLRASDIVGANTSNKLPRVWSNTKCIILYYYCTDETSEPEMTPECAQCARHTKYFLYSTSNMYIFEPIPKLMMPKQEPFHCPDKFPFPALGHAPCDFISWGCCVCSAVCKHCAPDSLEGYWSVRIVFIPISPGLEHFTRGKWSPWTVWAVRLQPVTTLQWLHAQIKTKHTDRAGALDVL